MNLRIRSAQTTIWLLITALAGAAGLVWAITGAPAAPANADYFTWFTAAIGFLVLDRFDAQFEVGDETHGVSADDALMVIALAFLPGPHLLVARIVGNLAGTFTWRHTSLQKFVFNVSNRCLEVGLAVALYHAILAGAEPVSPRGWLAGAVATIVGSMVNHTAVGVVIALATGRRMAFGHTMVQAAIVACSVVVGLVGVDVLWIDSRGAWKLVLGFIILTVGYRMYVRARDRLDDLRAYERFTNGLAGATETDDVVLRALGSARDIMRATDARLLFGLPDGGVTVSELDHRGELLSPVVYAEAVSPSISGLLAIREPVLIAADDRTADRWPLELLGWSDLISAPFTLEGGQPATLLVGNRLNYASTFDAGDLALLETFAANTSTALRVGELVQQLRSQAMEKEHQSRHDALTKLPNRMVADERLRQVLPHATDDMMVAVLFMDLDRFKEVNDALGHHVGDELLKEVANRLRLVMGRRGTVARLGGDEFAVVIPGVGDVSELAGLAHELRDEISKPVLIDRLSLNPLGSIGIALAPHDGVDARSLFQRADVAMYAAKNRRTGFEFYDPRFDKASTRTLSLTADLRTALATDQLVLHYQPQAALDGRVVAVEALARWPHPRYGSVPPEEFVHVAEQHGLIHQLTRWAIGRALADLAEWRRDFPELGVSVNMSARDLMDLSFPTDVEAMLAEHGLPPGALTLELTESEIVSDIHRSVEMLGRLRALGVRLAIDDFGTGQSSLAYLRSLPIHEVKIDRSFVLGMSANTDDAVIVRSTIEMAHNLGLTAVAEGVEDPEVWRMLAEQGCDAAQGYHITPALPIRELNRWLARRHLVFHTPRALTVGREGDNVIRLVPRAG